MVDRLVLMHGLETSREPRGGAGRGWRVLGPGGRALFIVPNRAGLWARRDITPFGFGRPYSPSQLEAQVKRHDFAPERHVSALYAPPSQRRFWLRTAPFWEAYRQPDPVARRRGADAGGLETGLRSRRGPACARSSAGR